MGSSAGAIRAGKAYVEIYGDDNPLQRTLNKVTGKMKTWGDGIGSVGKKMLIAGSAVTASLGGAIVMFANAGSEIHDMSQRTGVSAEALSTLGFVAEQSGVGMEGLEGGLRKMQKTLGGADEGSAEAAASLTKLGLSIEGIKDLSPDQQFRTIGEKLAGIHDPTLRAAEAMKIFGKSGTDLLPMFAEGAVAMAEQEKLARSLGLEWSQKDANAADRLGDAMGACWAVIKRIPVGAVAKMSDAITGVVESGTRIIVTASNWIQENSALVVGLGLTASAIALTGAALYGLGTALAIGSSILATMGTVLGFMLSPAVLITTAVAGLGAAILYYSGVGSTALGWLGEKFGELKADAQETFNGISDALSSGDIEGAMKILWLSLQLEWAKGTQGLMDNWTGFKVGFQKVAVDAFYGVLEIANNVWAAMQSGWADFINWFTDVWKVAQNKIASLSIDVMAYFDSSINAADAKGILNDDFNRDKNGRASSHAANKSQIEKDRQAQEDELAQQNIGANAGLDAAGKAEAEARQRELEALKTARDAAIANAAANRKNPTDENAGKHGFDTAAVTASKHGPVTGVDVKSTEGFKSVLTAINDGQNDPARETVTTLKGMAATQKRQEKHEWNLLQAVLKVGTVGTGF